MKGKEIIFGLLIALILAVFVSPFASPRPDGLERVAEDKGFLEKGEVQPLFSAPVPDYAWPGVKSEKVSTAVAGGCGTLIIFCLAGGVALILKKKSRE